MVQNLQDSRRKARKPIRLFRRMQEQEVRAPPQAFENLLKRSFPRYATDIVRECAEAWERLIIGKTQRGDISL